MVALVAFSTGARATEKPVDLALVLAADVSGSITREELKLQREGYAQALVSPRVLEAIKQGPYGRIAVSYIEWSGEGAVNIAVGWTTIAGTADLAQVADQIRTFVPPEKRNRRAGRTSISYALRFGTSLFGELGRTATRRVIDISGDGVNNDGEDLVTARMVALRENVTINGLAIGNDVEDGEPIASYYAREVIGGPGAFVEPAAGVSDFEATLERKLWREIAAAPSDAARAGAIPLARDASRADAAMAGGRPSPAS